MSASLTSRFVELPHLKMHVLEAGSGERHVVMLHGFPDLSRTWRFQAPALADAGFHVVAPDLRGYGASGRPEGVESYGTEHLVGDVLALFDSLGAKRVRLVGHDWGAVIAWHVAMRAPERLEKLAIINGPHPIHYRAMLKRPTQLARSWYVGAMQLPWLPERLLCARDAAILLRFLEEQAPNAFTSEDREAHREALTRPGALTAMLNYYRAAAREFFTAKAAICVDTPTLILWGDQDLALVPALADVPASLASNTRVQRFPEAGHFAHLQEPERVSEALIEFLR